MSKRIHSKNPSVSGGGGGATTLDVPSARWSDDASADDGLARLHLVTDENAQVDDSLAYILAKSGEDAQLDSAWLQTIISANAEDTNCNDLVKLQMINMQVGRSATPDSDLMFDAYTNQLAAFAGTNFGNVSPMTCRGVTTVSPGSDEQRAYMALDLTGFAGCTQVANVVIEFQCANSNLLTATTVTCTATTTATKPFTESTVTWSAPPTIGTNAGTTTQNVAAGGGYAAYFVSLGAGGMYGKWVLFTFTGPSAATTVLVDTFSIRTRDDATASNRPKVSFTAQRGA